ncbi:MAG: hypothetical protein ACE361_00455 [Aureliella sp.]
MPIPRIMMSVVHRKAKLCAALGMVFVLISSTGCISLVANLMHAINGNELPAEYDGLVGKRVAMICQTDEGFRTTAASTILTNNLHAALNMHVEDIDLVPHSEIEKWVDVHGQQGVDYVEVGKAVKAERVVAVEVAKLGLTNGPTLFKGSADISVTVYDIERGGKLIFRKQMPDCEFPTTDGKPVSETTESKFRSFYLAILTRRISGIFYPVDPTADVALDATMSSF